MKKALQKFDASNFEWISFDCYGTLVDWEQGIVRALSRMLKSKQVVDNGESYLEHYARLETAAEKGDYRPYSEVLAKVVDERLSGEPTRLLVSLTQSTVAHRFISPDSRLGRQMGPGLIGSESALVVAVEGQIQPESGSDNQPSADPRSFVFVEPVGNPEFTTCVIRESPLLLNQSDFLYGSFDFEPFKLPQ